MHDRLDAGPIDEQPGCRADWAPVGCALPETIESHFSPPHDGEVIREPQAEGRSGGRRPSLSPALLLSGSVALGTAFHLSPL